MTKIAVVDDDEMFTGQVSEAIRKDFSLKKMPVEVERFYGSRRLLGVLDEHQTYDVYFLDVEMDYVNGVELAKRIRAMDSNAIIIFLTSHEKYAIAGYSCRAFEYITKEKWQKRLPDILKQVQKNLSVRDSRIYRIQTERKYEIINWNDIYYIEKNGKNTLFHCKNGKTYQLRNPLGEVYKRLSDKEFVYVNRGQIINLMHVTHLDAETVELGEDISLDISRNLLSDIRQKLMGYWRVV